MKRLRPLLVACCRLIVAGILWISMHVSRRIVIHGLERLPKGTGPMYFAMAHKRDVDPMVELATILARRGWHALTRDVYFAIRSDAFAARFLARVVPYPLWLSRLLGLLSLSALLRLLGLRPLENIYIRPVEIWLRDALEVEGDRPAAELCTPAFLQDMARISGEEADALAAAPLSHLLAWRYHTLLITSSSVDIFLPAVRLRIKNHVLAKLKQELEEVGDWLRNGGSVWGAPEGQLSPDGKIGPFTAAFHRLVQAGRPETGIIPISIVYDYMTIGLPRAFVGLAPIIERAPTLATRDLDARLRTAWLLNAHFTCTQLASSFLIRMSREERSAFTCDELAAAINKQAMQLQMAGRCVDPRLLHTRKVRRLAARYLKYAAQHHLARRIGRVWLPTIDESDFTLEVSQGSVGYMKTPLAYAWNELQDLLSVGQEPERAVAGRVIPADTGG